MHVIPRFYKNAQCMENLTEVFNTFSLSSRLKPNLTKCDRVGIEDLEGVPVAVCGMRCIDLSNEATKTLGTYFLYSSRKRM